MKTTRNIISITGKKKHYILITIISLIVVSFLYKGFLSKKINSYSDELINNEHSDVAVMISANQGTVSQSFSANSFDAISIKFGTYERKNTSILKFQLMEVESNELIYETYINTSKILDNMFYYIELPETLVRTNDTKFQFILSSEESDLDNCIAVWTNSLDEYKNGEGSFYSSVQSSDISFKVSISQESSNLNIIIIFVLFLLILFLNLIFYLLFDKKKTISEVYLITIICLGTIFSLLITPQNIPDEIGHFFNSYKVSNFIMGREFIVESSDYVHRSYSSIPMRKCDMISWNFRDSNFLESYNKVIKYLALPSDNLTEELYTVSLMGEADYLYIPQGIGITIGRVLNLNFMQLYYMGKIFNLLIFALVSYFSIKAIPFGKSILFIIFILPMCLNQVSSYSGDALVIGLVSLFISYVLKLSFDSNMQLNTKYIIFISILGALVVSMKTGTYAPVSLLLFLIPKDKFNTRKKYCKCIACFLGISTIMFLIVNFTRISDLLISQSNFVLGNYTYTLSFLLEHPKDFFYLLHNTLSFNLLSYINMMLGSSLGVFSIHLPDYLLLANIGVVLVSALKTKSKIRIQFKDKMILLISFILTSFFILLAMLLLWTPFGVDQIRGVQGRYFLPIIILLLLLLRFSPISLNIKSKRNIIYFSICLQVITIVVLFISAIGK